MFRLLKKLFTETSPISKPLETVDFEHLTKEGELPWGWIYRNKDFTDKINNEFSYFLKNWIDAKQKSPHELYEALKSFVLYLEDAAKLCKSKGECFEFWYNEILASKDYIDKRRSELIELSANRFKLQEIYDKKQNLFPTVIDLLKANDGILQSDFKQLFDEPYQIDVTNILYQLNKEGRLEKIKSGRTYILHLRG